MRLALQIAAVRTWSPYRVATAVLAALCGIALALAMWWGVPVALRRVREHPYFALTDVRVEGVHRLRREDVMHVAGVREGMSSWDVSPHVLRTRLLTHDWVRSVEVFRQLPERLTIRIVERRPAAIVLLDKPHYVDAAGRIVAPLTAADDHDYPVISGSVGEGDHDFAPRAIHRALQVVRVAAKSGAFDGLSEVHVDRNLGVTAFPLRPAVPVILGWGNWSLKLSRAAKVLAAWEPQIWRVREADASFPGEVVVRLRDPMPLSQNESNKRKTSHPREKNPSNRVRR